VELRQAGVPGRRIEVANRAENGILNVRRARNRIQTGIAEERPDGGSRKLRVAHGDLAQFELSPEKRDRPDAEAQDTRSRDKRTVFRPIDTRVANLQGTQARGAKLKLPLAECDVDVDACHTGQDEICLLPQPFIANGIDADAVKRNGGNTEQKQEAKGCDKGTAPQTRTP